MHILFLLFTAAAIAVWGDNREGTVDFNEDNVLFPGPSGTARGSEHPGGKDAKGIDNIVGQMEPAGIPEKNGTQGTPELPGRPGKRGPSEAHPWVYIPLTLIGDCTLKSSDTTSHPLTSAIPSSAVDVLIYVETDVGNNRGQDTYGRLQVYALRSGRKYAFYVGAHIYDQNAWVMNSDNVWLPASRTIYAQYLGEPSKGAPTAGFMSIYLPFKLGNCHLKYTVCSTSNRSC